jgi:hypothetical protein
MTSTRRTHLYIPATDGDVQAIACGLRMDNPDTLTSDYLPTVTCKRCLASKAYRAAEAEVQAEVQAIEPAPAPLPEYANGRADVAYVVPDQWGPVALGPYWPGVDCLWQGRCCEQVLRGERQGRCQHCGAPMGPAEQAALEALALAERAALQATDWALPMHVRNARTGAVGHAPMLVRTGSHTSDGGHQVSVLVDGRAQTWAYADTDAA